DRVNGTSQVDVVHVLDSAAPVFEPERGDRPFDIVRVSRKDGVGSWIKKDSIAVRVVPAGSPGHGVCRRIPTESLSAVKEIILPSPTLRIVVIAGLPEEPAIDPLLVLGPG